MLAGARGLLRDVVLKHAWSRVKNLKSVRSYCVLIAPLALVLARFCRSIPLVILPPYLLFVSSVFVACFFFTFLNPRPDSSLVPFFAYSSATFVPHHLFCCHIFPSLLPLYFCPCFCLLPPLRSFPLLSFLPLFPCIPPAPSPACSPSVLSLPASFSLSCAMVSLPPPSASLTALLPSSVPPSPRSRPSHHLHLRRM